MANNQKKYASFTTLQNLVSNIKSLFATKADVNTELAKKADSVHTHTIANVTNLQTTLDAKVPTSRTVNGKALTANITLSASDVGAAPTSHNHNDDYYVKTEVDTKLSGKANSSHTHTIANVTNLQSTLDGKSNTSHSHTTHSQATMSNTDLNTIKTAGWYYGYTGMTNAPVQNIAVMEVLVYSPDWIVQRFIVVNGAEYIRHWHSGTTWSEWKTNVDSGNIGSQSVASATKATQDGNGKVISSTYETKSDASAKLTEAKTYADNAANAVKNDLLNNAGAAYDTLKELGDLIDDNKDAIDALETVASGKANAVHTHAISDVTGLQSALDGKAASSHGTHVSFDSTNKPKMDGTAAFGTSSKVARADHVHPTDTSRASKTEFDSHNSDTTKHITSTERTNWNAAKTHADSAHAPSNAQPNQNAFSNIKVGSTTIAADTTTDTLTFVGSNVSITTDATNDKVTFSVANGSTSTKGVVQLTDSVTSTSTTTAATPKNVKAAYDLANQAKTTADSKANASHTHTVANITDLTATATELNYMDGVTSNVQAQLDSKVDENHTHSWEDLEDKPFYETEPVDTVIVPTLTFNNWYYESKTSLTPLVDGQKGTVVYDGTTYTDVECKDNGNGMVILGSVNRRYNDYPFAVYISNGYLFIDTPYASGSVTHTIQVTIGVTDVVKLDEKFLPNFAGEVVSNKTFSGYEEVGGTFAEIFNDYKNNVATGDYAHAEGKATKALGDNSHSEGNQTTASGTNSHVEGEYSVTKGSASHAEGYSCTSEAGYGNHAEGFMTTAKGDASHSEGYYTIAGSSNQHVQGKYNIEDTSNKYAHIVGNGDYNTRSNAHTLDWNGNAWFAGNIYTGGTSQGSGATMLASISTVSTAEYTALEKSEATNANTLYMITDGEEETPTQVQIITWGADD